MNQKENQHNIIYQSANSSSGCNLNKSQYSEGLYEHFNNNFNTKLIVNTSEAKKKVQQGSDKQISLQASEELAEEDSHIQTETISEGRKKEKLIRGDKKIEECKQEEKTEDVILYEGLMQTLGAKKPLKQIKCSKFEEEKVQLGRRVLKHVEAQVSSDDANFNIAQTSQSFLFYIMFHGKQLDKIKINMYSQEEVSINEKGDEEEKISNENSNTDDCQSLFRDYKVKKVLGKGAHGAVLEIQDDRGRNRALKLYKRYLEKVFIKEVSVLSMLQELEELPDFAIKTTIQTKGFYGAIMDAGEATLLDFKCFLIDKQIQLDQNELLHAFNHILEVYTPIHKIGFCHRDLKPENIIIFSEGYDLVIIDYSLAECFKHIPTLSGIVGTPGYIDPRIVKKAKDFTTEDLVSGDMFSIGIILLGLAVPQYVPRQSDIEELKNLISKFADEKEIFSLLNTLLFTKISNFDELKKLAGKSTIDGLLGKHRESFMKYLKNKLVNTTKGQRIMEELSKYSHEILDLSTEFESTESQSIAEQYNVRDWWRDISCGSAEMTSAISYYKERDNKEALLHSYENMVRLHITTKRIKEGSDVCEEILELLGEDSINCHPLMYSTIGICFYLQKDVKKAREMFRRGLDKSKHNDLYTLILLNNYLCTLLILNEPMEDYDDAIQKLYNNLTRNIIPEMFDFIIDKCLTMNFKVNQSAYLFENYIKEEGRRPEYMLSLVEPKDHDTISLVHPSQTESAINLVAFLNLCFAKASVLREFIKANKKQNFLMKLIRFGSYFIHQKNSTNILPMYLEILMNLLKLQDLFINDESVCYSLRLNKYAKLKQELQSLLKKKAYLYNLFSKGPTQLIFEELQQSELFFVMIGLSIRSQKLDKIRGISQLKKDKVEFTSEFSNFIETVTVFDRKDKDQKEWYDILFHDELSDTSNSKNEVQHLSESELDNLCVILEKESFIHIIGSKENLKQPEGQKCRSWYLNHLELIITSTGLCAFELILKDVTRVRFLEKLSFEVDARQSLTDQEALYLHNILSKMNLLMLHLAFTKLTNITDNHIGCIAEAIISQKSLYYLKLKFEWSYLTPKAISFMSDSISTLNSLEQLHLVFKWCPNITNESLFSFVFKIAKLHLKVITLDFTSCANISSQGLEKLRPIINQMQSLQVKVICVTPVLIRFTPECYGEIKQGRQL